MTYWGEARCWQGNDGQHVWLAHQCSAGWTEAMLPWPTWHIVQGAVRRVVEPSVVCESCGLHWVAAPVRQPFDLAERLLHGLPTPEATDTDEQEDKT